MKSTVSSKGQITLPAQVREQLGLLPGTIVQFEIGRGILILRKGGPAGHPVDQIFGRLKLAKPVDQLLDDMRGPRPAPRRAASRPSSRRR